jgi:hypothetical protein
MNEFMYTLGRILNGLLAGLAVLIIALVVGAGIAVLCQAIF